MTGAFWIIIAAFEAEVRHNNFLNHLILLSIKVLISLTSFVFHMHIQHFCIHSSIHNDNLVKSALQICPGVSFTYSGIIFLNSDWQKIDRIYMFGRHMMIFPTTGIQILFLALISHKLGWKIPMFCFIRLPIFEFRQSRNNFLKFG